MCSNSLPQGTNPSNWEYTTLRSCLTCTVLLQLRLVKTLLNRETPCLLTWALCNPAADQASQEHPALSAAQRSSGVASTSQPSKQQQPAQESSHHTQRPQHDSAQPRHGESSQHPQGVQAGSSQQPHGVSVGKHSHHVRLQGPDPSPAHPGQAGGSRSQPESRELEELFAVLSSWLNLAESRAGLPLWGR